MLLRFRTKKAFLEAKKAAKEKRLSLNEFVIRCVEDLISTTAIPGAVLSGRSVIQNTRVDN